MTDQQRALADPIATTRRRYLVGVAALGAGSLAAPSTALAQEEAPIATTFTVRIENVSTSTTLLTTEGDQPVPLSPGAYAVHASGEPLFSSGEPERDNGLEEVAEDGDPRRLAESLAMDPLVDDSGAFATPVGADEPGPIGPGQAYEFSVAAAPPQFLSLVTMFVPSNDLYYALGGSTGLSLFEDNTPVSGDVTDRVGLWDAGTEVNEQPGVGENQVQRQPGPSVGLVERGTVAPIEEVNGYTYPPVAEVVRVTVTPAPEGTATPGGTPDEETATPGAGATPTGASPTPTPGEPGDASE